MKFFSRKKHEKESKNPPSGSGEQKRAASASPLESARMRTLERDRARAEGKPVPAAPKPAQRSKNSEKTEVALGGAFSGKTELPLEHKSPEEVNREAAAGQDTGVSETPSQQIPEEEPGKSAGAGSLETSKPKGQPDSAAKEAPAAPEAEKAPRESVSQKEEGERNAEGKKLSNIHVSDQRTLLRTYEGDAAKALRTNKGSVAKIALAEQKKRKEREEKQADLLTRLKNDKVFAGLVITVFLVAGGAVLFFVGKAINDRGNDAIITAEKSELIFAEHVQTINTANMRPEAFKNEVDRLLESSHELDTFTEIIPYEMEVEWPVRISTADLVFFLSLGPSDSLLRSLGEEYAFAIHAFDGNSLVLVARVESYEQAFAGMLAWEPSMITDFRPFSPKIEREPIRRRGAALAADEKETAAAPAEVEEPQTQEIGTSTQATSTNPSAQQAPPSPQIPTDRFVDVVIQNHDARVLHNEAGEGVLLYAFPNRSVLVITTSRDSFEKTLNRLNTAQFSR